MSSISNQCLLQNNGDNALCLTNNNVFDVTDEIHLKNIDKRFVLISSYRIIPRPEMCSIINLEGMEIIQQLYQLQESTCRGTQLDLPERTINLTHRFYFVFPYIYSSKSGVYLISTISPALLSTQITFRSLMLFCRTIFQGLLLWYRPENLIHIRALRGIQDNSTAIHMLLQIILHFVEQTTL